jgi:hypothetical protein
MSRQLWWRVGKWRPDTELYKLSQQIEHDKFGEDLMESYKKDYECGDWLVYSGYFEKIFFDDDFGRIPFSL